MKKREDLFEDFDHANLRAREAVRTAIRSNKIPKPNSCDGCGRPGMFRKFIFDVKDPFTFAAYCKVCWKDHQVERLIKERRIKYEQRMEEDARLLESTENKS